VLKFSEAVSLEGCHTAKATIWIWTTHQAQGFCVFKAKLTGKLTVWAVNLRLVGNIIRFTHHRGTTSQVHCSRAAWLKS
jgi:hypothetical protein